MKDSAVLLLYIVAITVVGFLLYSVLNRPQKIQIYNEIPPQTIPTHWWGYGWRPWWRKYNGMPGLEAIPDPKIPKPPKPIIIPK